MMRRQRRRWEKDGVEEAGEKADEEDENVQEEKLEKHRYGD